jgi:hypothetical protein
MNSRVVAVAGVVALALVAGVAIYLVVGRSEPSRPVVVEAPARTAPEPSSADEPAPVGEPSSARPPGAEKPAEAAPRPAPAASASEGEPLTATLRINSDVPGAEVFLDRTFLGVTPLTVTDVAPGSHRLNVTATGHEGLAETIDVVPGPREITFEFKAIRLDVTAGVVHKHALGSCEGTLSATPDGLRYDTTNKDDAFMVPLTGLDTFAVDYLKKNLTLKLRNGKTYNFTDPAGNADRLFVFHRDVDKVRARLSP